ncbi:MAG: HAMP domain-containing histidine kinase [Betaproteobacteria bacterium]|nr:HAMP domain-containing histidine kinase [Betaproteobacteria bacterium]
MKLSGVTLIKVFNRDNTIAWSSEPSLIGKSLVTHHPDDLQMAFNGEVRAVFNPGKRTAETAYMFPRLSLIEFYVPFTFSQHAKSGSISSSGVLAIYRFPQELNQTIQEGIFIVWVVTGVGGLILFAALYTLFRSVYYRQREAESQFAKLSTDHRRLVQMEKLSAMGQLVSEIAHQLNNPLVGVVNLAELAERETDDPQRVKELLGDIRKAGDHCRNFVQRMLRFNQVARSEPQLIEMKAMVHETIAFLRQSMSSHPSMVFEAPDGDVMLEVDPVLIRHALFNVLHNAALAAPESPVVVTLTAEEVHGVAGWRISVADSGIGLAPEVKAKLFTPFFTTREGGTGLGLTVAHHIVLQHHGSIHAENKPDGGALFVIWLPAIK